MQKTLSMPLDILQPSSAAVIDAANLHSDPLRGSLHPLGAPRPVTQGDFADLRRLGACSVGSLYTHGGELWLWESATRQMVCLGGASCAPTQMWRHGTLLRLVNPSTGRQIILDDALPRPVVCGVVDTWPSLAASVADTAPVTADVAARTLGRAYDGRGEALTPSDARAVTSDIAQAYRSLIAQAAAQRRAVGTVMIYAQYVARDGSVLHATEPVTLSGADTGDNALSQTVEMDADRQQVHQYSLRLDAFRPHVSLVGTLPPAVAERVASVRVMMSPQVHRADLTAPMTLIPGGPGRRAEAQLFWSLAVCDMRRAMAWVESRIDELSACVGEYTLASLASPTSLTPTQASHWGNGQEPQASLLPRRALADSRQRLQADDLVLHWGDVTVDGQTVEGIVIARSADPERLLASVSVGGTVLAVCPLRMGRFYGAQRHHYLVAATTGVYDMYIDASTLAVTLSRRGAPAPANERLVVATSEGVYIIVGGRLWLHTTSGASSSFDASALPWLEGATAVTALPDGTWLVECGQVTHRVWPLRQWRHCRQSLPLQAPGAMADDGLIVTDEGVADLGSATPDGTAAVPAVRWSAETRLPKGCRVVTGLKIDLRASRAHLTVTLGTRLWRVDGPVRSPLVLRPMTAPAGRVRLTLEGALSADACLDAVTLACL